MQRRWLGKSKRWLLSTGIEEKAKFAETRKIDRVGHEYPIPQREFKEDKAIYAKLNGYNCLISYVTLVVNPPHHTF